MKEKEIMTYAEMVLNAVCEDEEMPNYRFDTCIQHPTEPSYYLVAGFADGMFDDNNVTVIIEDGNPMNAWALRDWQMYDRITTWEDVDKNKDEFMTIDGREPIWLNGLPRILQ